MEKSRQQFTDETPQIIMHCFIANALKSLRLTQVNSNICAFNSIVMMVFFHHNKGSTSFYSDVIKFIHTRARCMGFSIRCETPFIIFNCNLQKIICIFDGAALYKHLSTEFNGNTRLKWRFDEEIKGIPTVSTSVLRPITQLFLLFI